MYERSDKGDSTTVLQGMGMFHIWAFIIFGPLVAIVLIAVAILVWNYHKGWVETKANCIKQRPPLTPSPKNSRVGTFGDTCCTMDPDVAKYSCPVTLENDKGTPKKQYKLILSSGDDPFAATWKVSYNGKDKDIEKSLTTQVVSDGARKVVVGVLVVILLVLTIYWIFNFANRGNKTWQNVSGVMEGADLASSVLSGSN